MPASRRRSPCASTSSSSSPISAAAIATSSTLERSSGGPLWTAPTLPDDRRDCEMTYGFLPQNWPAFQRQLDAHGIALADIEKVEIRPSGAAAGSATMIDVVVTSRSGRGHAGGQGEGAPGTRRGARRDG